MRLTLCICALSAPFIALADCEWSDEYLIPIERKLSFQECVADKKIRIGEIEVQANIEFQIVHSDYPEGNSIWSIHSPDGMTAVVWIENSSFQRNLWVIDPEAKNVLLFSDHSEGRHLNVEFDSNERFRIIHAGMGYRTDYVYERIDGAWTNTGQREYTLER